jgi:hypothetical protein
LQVSQQHSNALGRSGTMFLLILLDVQTCNTRSLYVLIHFAQHLY